ncbi:MAG: hypothetical protein J0I98_16050 [Mesorhizobium sp.]|nr:hypothetical protein [Mesorhizobium sp.]MBN9244299.1 hypothetical protein [Mesorhizobium sp.]
MSGNQSEKPVVFEHLFSQRYDAATASVIDPIVTQGDIQEALTVLRAELGIALSVGNPANFLKDYLRSPTRNTQWPVSLSSKQFTARQAFGGGAVFEFVPYPSGQTEPFPDVFALPAGGQVHVIESVSLPSVARALGRDDESWLTQVIVLQRVLETHFAVYSDLNVIDLFHLQNNRKGGAKTEIDALFLMVLGDPTDPKKALITFEAKRRNPILADQIRKQVAYTAKQCTLRAELSDITLVLPVAAGTNSKKFGKGVVAIFEMEPVTVADGAAAHDAGTSHDLPLTISNAVGYRFQPSVSGI